MPQVVIDSLVRSSELAILAVGLTMVYSILRIPNFAHVEFATLGGYFAFFIAGVFGANLVLAAVLATLLVGLMGVATNELIFSRMSRHGPIMLMVASFALAIVMRETVNFIWGPSSFYFNVGLQQPIYVFETRITRIQISILVATVLCIGTLHILLKYTKLGIAMRAMADNPVVAEASGISVKLIVRVVWFIGCALAGVGGVLLGLDTQLHPTMGLKIILAVFAAAILGGIGSPYGALLGALVVGFAENIGIWINWAGLFNLLGLTQEEFVFVPAGYKPAASFVVLILVLLFLPKGIAGGLRSR